MFPEQCLSSYIILLKATKQCALNKNVKICLFVRVNYLYFTQTLLSSIYDLPFNINTSSRHYKMVKITHSLKADSERNRSFSYCT